MLIGTHTLLPVCLALGVEDSRLALGRPEAFPVWSIPAIGVFGALPDLCSPHLSLEARYSSWSHALLFLAILLPVVAGCSTFFPKGTRCRLAVWFWLAAALHLAADAISGGIPWLLPWRTEPIGAYYIHPNYWPASDVFFGLLTGALVLLRRPLRARFHRGPAVSPS